MVVREVPLGNIPTSGGTTWGTLEFSKRHISMLNEGSFGSSVVVGEDRFLTWWVKKCFIMKMTEMLARTIDEHACTENMKLT
jgi:hypothetical protein